MERWLDTHRTMAGWAAFAGTLLLVGLTLTDQGITWDEPVYFGSAQLQVSWVRMLLTEGPSAALDRDTVFGMWDWDHYYNPHPPVYKDAMALTWFQAASARVNASSVASRAASGSPEST